MTRPTVVYVCSCTRTRRRPRVLYSTVLLWEVSFFFLFFSFFLFFLYRRLIVKDEIRGVLDEYTTKFSDVVKENQQLRKENLLLKNVY